MNNYVYSPSQNMIFPVAQKQLYVDAGTWPSDAIDISEETAREFNQQFPAGKTMSHDENNQPCWVDIPPPTHDELIEAAEADKLRRIDQANEYMNSKQWPGKAAIGRLKGEELEQYGLWLDYLDALDAVNTSSAPDINWPVPPEL